MAANYQVGGNVFFVMFLTLYGVFPCHLSRLYLFQVSTFPLLLLIRYYSSYLSILAGGGGGQARGKRVGSTWNSITRNILVECCSKTVNAFPRPREPLPSRHARGKQVGPRGRRNKTVLLCAVQPFLPFRRYGLRA